jgi:hypothetical protein
VQNWQYLKKIKMEFPYDLAILSIYLKELRAGTQTKLV